MTKEEISSLIELLHSRLVCAELWEFTKLSRDIQKAFENSGKSNDQEMIEFVNFCESNKYKNKDSISYHDNMMAGEEIYSTFELLKLFRERNSNSPS